MRTPRRSLLLVLGTGLAAPALEAQAAGPSWLEAWQQVLQQRVDALGRVDFAGIAAEPDFLSRVVGAIGAEGPRGTGAEVLAWQLNAYNALAMWGIVQRGIPRSLGLIGRFAFFANTTIRVAGRDTSLKSFEDDVIRRAGEERVHFALNCMVRGCPRLPREAFRGARLEEQLSAAAREFCETPRHVRPDHARRINLLSQIFEFFTGDFVPAKAPDLVSYVNAWRREALPWTYELRFIEYDWTVNAQPGRSAGGG